MMEDRRQISRFRWRRTLNRRVGCRDLHWFFRQEEDRMWLAYLRFDAATATRVALVRCSNRSESDEVLDAGKRFVGWALTEYAVFYAHATTHARVVPNFPEDLIYEAGAFLRACNAASNSGSDPSAPPGSSGRRDPKLRTS
jgi:hypothetical protein